jgi:hypothetical protein
MRRWYVWSVILMLLHPIGAAGQGVCDAIDGPPAGGRGAAGETLPPRRRGVFDLCFDGQGWRVQPPAGRITSRDAVAIRLRHFNFLRYTLHLDANETRAESYAYLTHLWSGVLGPLAGDVFGAAAAAPPPAPDPLVDASRATYASAQELQRRIEAAIAPYTRSGLTRQEAGALDAAIGEVREAAARLDASYATLQRLVETDALAFKEAFAGTTKAYYKIAVDSYEAARTRSATFLALAVRSAGDDTRELGVRDAGTRVAVTLTATDPDGVASAVQTVHYVSQSLVPLVAHGGVAFSGIRDVTFEKVRRAVQFSGEDFFANPGTGGSATGFSAFLAWQLLTGGASLDAGAKEQPLGLLVSIGTDLSSPGRRLYLGPSLMLGGRLIVTAGAALGKTSEGEEPIEPDVFRLVRARGAASWFSALTVRLY